MKKDLTNIEMSIDIPGKNLEFGKVIGKGSFGLVYMGVWNHSNVAIKELLSNSLTTEQEAEFKQEAHLMVQLKAPHIIQCYGICIDRYPYCIVMEFMPNGSLFNVLRVKGDQLSWGMKERIGLEVALGLAYLHSMEILHRDLKSLNVLLDENMKAKLCDFGLAKLKSDPSTFVESARGAMGTPMWMAPELLDPPAQYSKYSDIFSFGVTLWEIVTCKIPFANAPNLGVAFQWVREGKREDIPEVCPPKLARLIKFCWNQSPKERPLTDQIIRELKENPVAHNDLSDFKKAKSSLPPPSNSANTSSPSSSNIEPITKVDWKTGTTEVGVKCVLM